MKVILLGYGKMGKAVEMAMQRSGMHAQVLHTFSQANIHTLTVELLREADVVIEFTTPLTAEKHIKMCIDAGVPVVSGTTGWYTAYEQTADYCVQHQGAMLCATNFSIGVQLFFAINARLAELMQSQPQYSVAIEETHHTQKLDAPSGTAISTAQVINTYMPRTKGWVLHPDQKQDAIPIIAHRLDHVPGIHTVTYNSHVDQISLTHSAHTRDGFADGAWLAARWIVGKKGVFTMRDVLGIA